MREKVAKMRAEYRDNRAMVEKVSEKVITELYSTILDKEEELNSMMRKADWLMRKIERRIKDREEKFEAILSEKIVEVDDSLEEGLEQMKADSRLALEFLKHNFAEVMRTQESAEQAEREAVERERSFGSSPSSKFGGRES